MQTDYRDFKKWLTKVPVIETHEHYEGITTPYDDIFELILGNYLSTDMMVANGGVDALATINAKETFEAKCDCFLDIFKNVRFTCYGQSAVTAFKIAYDVDISTKAGLNELKKRQPERTQEFHDKLIADANIKAGICDVFYSGDMLNDKTKRASWCRLAIRVSPWHAIRSFQDITVLRDETFGNAKINTLDDYLLAMDGCVKMCIDSGLFKTMKDPSAYWRDLAYKNPTKDEAEKAFNKLMENKEKSIDDTIGRVLDDYLFHRIIDLSVKYDIPVQIHTGHMAGGYNDLVKTNAAQLTPLLNLHLDATFDLFHGNYPYMGDYLFLGKNYPNVVLDLCWLYSIDTDYSYELIRRMILTCPTSQVVAYGGDTMAVEHQVAYLDQARATVAKAMCSLIGDGILSELDAKQISADWFFNNPNRLYKLGFDDFDIATVK